MNGLMQNCLRYVYWLQKIKKEAVLPQLPFLFK